MEERVHLEAVGVSMSVRNWRIDLLKKGLAEDNKEVREGRGECGGRKGGVCQCVLKGVVEITCLLALKHTPKVL